MLHTAGVWLASSTRAWRSSYVYGVWHSWRHYAAATPSVSSLEYGCNTVTVFGWPSAGSPSSHSTVRTCHQANAYADRLAQESKSLVDESMRRAEQRLRRRLLAKAVRDAEATVKTGLDAADHQRLIEDAIDKLASAAPEGPRKAAGR